MSASASVKSRIVPAQAWPWQSLNFLPLPQGQGALRGVRSQSDFTVGCMVGGSATAVGVAAGPPSAATDRAAAAIPDAPSSGAEYCMLDTACSSPPTARPAAEAPLPLPLGESSLK